MKQKKECKKLYVAPEYNTIQVEAMQFICASVTPNASASQHQWGYDDKGVHEVGSIILGDETTVAPAKKNYFEEDED